ncbi:hypothetical protein LIER_26402 [Lithospermum erythrorhizon]|uniref:Protein FLX-like 1 n=1 Tax=Lithospermum erythrorhizon TaxID=34254 RepID=A0AAV3RC67_LITER
MSGRNHGHPAPIGPHGGYPPPSHEPLFPRPGAFGRGPHPSMLEELREAQFGMGPRQLPPHPAIMDEQLAAQHQDIQGLLVDNQRLAATHVALKQELEAAQFELQRTDHYARSFHAEKDIKMRELYEKSMKMENDLGEADAMRAELMQIRADIQELTAARQDLTAQSQAMTQDLTRMTTDLQKVPAVKVEIEGFKQELQRARAAIEYEKKSYTETYENGKLMENKLLAIHREVEKLRAEMANAEKRAQAAATVGNQGGNYNASYGNQETGYAVPPYPAGYGMNPAYPVHPMQAGAEGYPRYGPAPGAWGAYDMQQAQGPR